MSYLKQAALTAAVTVAFIALMNQFDQTKQLLSGGNRYFN
jgi:hypothetical protein